MKQLDWRIWLVIVASVVAIAVWGSVGWYLWIADRQEVAVARQADATVTLVVGRRDGQRDTPRHTPTPTRGARIGRSGGHRATATPSQLPGGQKVVSPTPTSTPVAMAPGGVEERYALRITDPGVEDVEMVWRRVVKLQAGKRVLVTVHDDHLTREANAYLASHPQYPYSGVSISFSERGFTASGTVDTQGVGLRLTVHGRLGARYCKPWVKVESVQVGRVNAPAAVYKNITSMIAKAMEQYPDDLPICVADVRTTDGALIAVGVMK